MKDMLEGQTTLITGGTGALGSAVSRAFLDAGSRVLVTYIVESERESLAGQLTSPGLSFERVDLFSETEVAALFSRVGAGKGRPDNLILLAGGFAGGHPVTDTPLAEWERMLALNTTSAFLCAKHGVPLMRDAGGSIVTVGSVMARTGTADFAAYGASKAALVNLTQAIAAEGKQYRIRANLVIPTIIDTPANRSAMPNADISQWVPPSNLAEILLFLCSESGSRISGESIKVG